MLRSIYILVLRLHPPSFRRRFSEEMLSIFDHEREHSLRLLSDVILSLARQWTLRSEFWEERLASVPISNDAPSFHSLNTSRPPTQALLNGAVISILVLGAVVLAISYSHNPTVVLPQIVLPDSARSTFRPPVSPTPLTRDDRSPRQASSTNLGRTTATVNPFSPLPTERGDVTVRSPLPQAQEHGSIASTRASASPRSRTLIGVQLPPALLRSYSGTYLTNASDLVLIIREQHAQLFLESPGHPQLRLIPISASKFLIEGAGNQTLEFSTSADCSIHVVYLNQELHHVMTSDR
jgi:hypothetical protein